jgi:hypothetical protein
LGLEAFSVAGCRARLDGKPHSEAIRSVRDDLYFILDRCATGILGDATTILYPSKALLLLCGFPPALDWNVRCGLADAGMSGFQASSPQSLRMPKSADHASFRKYFALTFLLGQCWIDHREALNTAARGSAFPEIATWPGRIFDVMLFVDGRCFEANGRRGWQDRILGDL